MSLSSKYIKKLNKLLINTGAVYWYFDGRTCDYIDRVRDMAGWCNTHAVFRKESRFAKELLAVITILNMTNEDIKNYIKDMDNPRDEWRKRMKEHNNGGRETRDNKGQFVYSTTTYHTPTRYKKGNIEHCNFNKIRYPKKCRSKRTWKKFYEMFPAQASIDNWDGNISDKMR